MVRYSIKIREVNSLLVASKGEKFHSEIIELKDTKEMVRKILRKKHSEELTTFTLEVCKVFKAKEIKI